MTTNRSQQVTVIGGGIAGLVAATTVAEAGVAVRLLEARRRIGGRGSSTPEPWVANLGPHALYTGTELWRWLRERGLHRPSTMPKSSHITFGWEGRIRRTPPRALIRAVLRLGAASAPVDQDLRSWATERWGDDTARALIGLAAPLTFDHDPGRISAAFVAERIGSILLRAAPTPRYVAGGWAALTARMADHARGLGVEIALDSKVEAGDVADLRSHGPVIVAASPGGARRLLGDEVPAPPKRRVALLDVGLTRRRTDPYLVMDLDRVVFSTRPSEVVGGLAPTGHDIVQLSTGMAPGEDPADAEARMEATLDAANDGWRDRTVWRQRAVVTDATGAVDLPGQTWWDRPAIRRGDGLWLAGDWVASPGHLAEVSVTSAITAAREAADAITSVGGHQPRNFVRATAP